VVEKQLFENIDVFFSAFSISLRAKIFTPLRVPQENLFSRFRPDRPQADPIKAEGSAGESVVLEYLPLLP